MAEEGAMERALARPVRAGAGEAAHLVHVSWELSGEAVQVYVDGELTEVAPAAERGCWLLLDRGAVREIELVGAWWTDAWRERLEARPGLAVALVRDEGLDVESEVVVSAGGQTLAAAPLWPGEAHRSGFGALFGEGGFGWDAATGPGLGLGELGMGPLGADGTAWRWHGGEVASDVAEVSVVDASGSVAAGPTVVESGRARLPGGATEVRFDGDWTLRWERDG